MEYVSWERTKNGYKIVYSGVDGKPVERTKEDYPYSYGPYILWGDPLEEGQEVVYSDRIPKNNLSWTASKNPKMVEELLNKYITKGNVKLTMIAEGANHATGYPYWVYGFEIV